MCLLCVSNEIFMHVRIHASKSRGSTIISFQSSPCSEVSHVFRISVTLIPTRSAPHFDPPHACLDPFLSRTAGSLLAASPANASLAASRAPAGVAQYCSAAGILHEALTTALRDRPPGHDPRPTCTVNSKGHRLSVLGDSVKSDPLNPSRRPTVP